MSGDFKGITRVTNSTQYTPRSHKRRLLGPEIKKWTLGYESRILESQCRVSEYTQINYVSRLRALKLKLNNNVALI